MADFLSNAGAHGSSYAPDSDRRRAPRKKLVRRVALTLPSGETLKGRTVDASQGGLSVLVDRPVALELTCTVRFDMYFNGRAMVIAGVGKVRNCALAGLDGFRIGMLFAIASPVAEEFMNEFLSPGAAGSFGGVV